MAGSQDANPNGSGYSYGWNKLFRRIVKTYCAVEKASVGEFNSQVIATTASITSAYLNTNYPDMPLGGKVTFTNVTDSATAFQVFTKITGSTGTGIWGNSTLDKV